MSLSLNSWYHFVSNPRVPNIRSSMKISWDHSTLKFVDKTIHVLCEALSPSSRVKFS